MTSQKHRNAHSQADLLVALMGFVPGKSAWHKTHSLTRSGGTLLAGSNLPTCGDQGAHLPTKEAVVRALGYPGELIGLLVNAIREKRVVIDFPRHADDYDQSSREVVRCDGDIHHGGKVTLCLCSGTENRSTAGIGSRGTARWSVGAAWFRRIGDIGLPSLDAPRRRLSRSCRSGFICTCSVKKG